MISLPDAKDRRARIPGHLAEAGIKTFEFHDACDPAHPDVKALYAQGLVAQFPPCFRCGKKDCGKVDCNNILIPAQVANFASHLALWKKISEMNIRALVLEDDVVLHPWTAETVEWLQGQVASHAVTFRPDIPALLRLGWALGDDHAPAKPRRISDEVRMSNPAYGITSVFAKAVLSRFRQVDTTSDIFLHRIAPRPGEAHTVFPPIASDMSWSLGSTASTIHPKQIHADFLRSAGHEAEATAYEATIARHIKHMFWRDILVLGHPRGGTGYIARMMQTWGLDVGHESQGKAGVSSWMLAVEDEAPWAKDPVARNRAALAFRTMIQVVRDPASAIPSILRLDEYAPLSFAYRRKHILNRFRIDLAKIASPLDRAVLSLTLWAVIIRSQSPTHVCRVEDDLSLLRDDLAAGGYDVDKGAPTVLPVVNADKLYKGLRYPKPVLSAQDWQSLSSHAQAELVSYCEGYGYPPIL